MNHTIRLRPAVAVLLFGFCSAASMAGASENANEPIEEIVVTADFRGRSTAELPAALSVLDREQLEQLAVQHFEEVVGVVPNLNWSGDGHRARYFQIRGVGELEQYQGAPNPSVGFLIDDIDFSGIGTIATLYDIERVEVLRGPQGSRYGANALGGLIYMQSMAPTAERNGTLTLSAADDDAYSAGIAFGGALNEPESALFRVSAHHHRSNGFRSNSYLGRNDTNGRDETSVRGRLHYTPTDVVDINIAVMYADVDNGYDAFALDNSYSVLSDKPGNDSQRSIGASLRIDWYLSASRQFSWLSSYADSDIEFGFDADWGNDGSWAPFVYDFISTNDRSRRTLSQEFRLSDSSDGPVDWLVGAYLLRLDDDLSSVNAGEYDDGAFPFVVFDTLNSSYEANTVALFGQVERHVGAATRLGAGLRFERRDSDYVDDSPLRADPVDDMVGGEVTLSHDLSDAVTGFVGISRGYKAGGFNLGIVPDELRQFRKESLWNLEAGIKSTLAGGAMSLNASVFRHWREDQQVRLSFQLNPQDPASFGFATVNTDGAAVGIEGEWVWQASDAWQVYASVGLIDTEFDRIVLPTAEFGPRETAHAPRYTFAAGALWRGVSGWFGRVDVSGKDEFYFDFPHDEQSDAYALVNLRAGYETSSWSAQMWVRNLFDERYAVRGFFFGNEPPLFEPTNYIRLGDPRQVGVTFEKRFGS